jgi:FAD/FMN-containing dehydrogenase
VSDGILAQSEGQAARLWAVRETIPEANRRIGAIASHDISLPLSHLAEFIERAGTAIARLGDVRVNCFGHVGDGNLHYNIFPPKGRSRQEFSGIRDDVKSTVYELVDEFGGSFSAEHGIGRMKVADLQRYGDPAKLSAMRAIKAALDPAEIMNPGAVLPVQGR